MRRLDRGREANSEKAIMDTYFEVLVYGQQREKQRFGAMASPGQKSSGVARARNG